MSLGSFAKCCKPCQLQQSSPSPTGLSKWEKTNCLFERIHIDFFHWKNETFLLVVDTFTRWLDVKAMKSTTAGNVIMELRVIFAYFGLPKTLVADNGPPFNSIEFRQFCGNNGITYLNSPPYHPSSNGWAECGVRTVKQSLKKMFIEAGSGKNSSLLVSRFLIKYRNTPLTTTGVTPSHFKFKNRPRTMMDVLTSEVKNFMGSPMNRVDAKEQKSKKTKMYNVKEVLLYRNEF